MSSGEAARAVMPSSSLSLVSCVLRAMIDDGDFGVLIVFLQSLEGFGGENFGHGLTGFVVSLYLRSGLEEARGGGGVWLDVVASLKTSWCGVCALLLGKRTKHSIQYIQRIYCLVSRLIMS